MDERLLQPRPARPAPERTPAPRPAGLLVDAEEFRTAFGEPLGTALDLTTWQPGENLAALYGQLDAAVRAAVAGETPVRQALRQTVLPRLRPTPDLPARGVYRATVADLELIHRGLLFTGAVEACNGVAVGHDGLAMTVTQIGICLVSYRADQGTWVHRLYRRDLHADTGDPVDLARAVLERRQGGAGERLDRTTRLSDLARRGIMAYAERAALLTMSQAPWRLGHGNPVAYELLTGSGSMDLLAAALDLLAQLIDGQRRFVFVPSGYAERGLLTIGEALRPLEYAIIDPMTDRMQAIVGRGHYAEPYGGRARAFAAEFGPRLIVGVYRASAVGPARLFYAHAEHAHEAALIALADSTLHEHRAFPTLLDLADAVCRTTFGSAEFQATIEESYATAGSAAGIALTAR